MQRRFGLSLYADKNSTDYAAFTDKDNFSVNPPLHNPYFFKSSLSIARITFPKARTYLSQGVGLPPLRCGLISPKVRAYARPSAGLGLHKCKVPNYVECKQEEFARRIFGLSPKNGRYASPFLDGYIRHVVQHIFISRTNDALPFKVQFFIAMGAPTHNARHGKQRSKDFLRQSNQFVNKS